MWPELNPNNPEYIRKAAQSNHDRAVKGHLTVRG
jgi:hypothetical protein